MMNATQRCGITKRVLVLGMTGTVFALLTSGALAADALRCPRLRDVRLEGPLAEKMNRFFTCRITDAFNRKTIFEEARSAFALRDDDRIRYHGDWRGEFWGKTMLSAARVADYLNDASLQTSLREECHRLLAFVDQNGYLGSYADRLNVSITPEIETKHPGATNWNIWNRKYAIWGLCAAAQLTHDDTILAAASRQMRDIIDMVHRDGVVLEKTGHRTLNGMPSMSVLKPLLLLYAQTKDPAFLAFARELVAKWDRADDLSPNFYRNASRSEALYAWYPQPELWAKTYEMLSCLDGLVEYYRVSGDARTLKTVRAIRDNLSRTESNSIGGLGIADRLLGARRFPFASTELCDIIHWIRLNLDLYLVTGDDTLLDAIEFSYFNGFLAGIAHDGHWTPLFIRDAGRHVQSYGHCGYAYHQCCLDNAPRTFMDLASIAVTRDRAGSFHVNFYQDATVTLDGVTFVIRGNYPACAKVTVRVTGDAKVNFRKPAWCPDMKVTRMSAAEYEIVFDMNPHLAYAPLAPADNSDGTKATLKWGRNRYVFRDADLRETIPTSATATLHYGPLLLARAKRLGLSREEIEAIPAKGASRVELRSLAADDVYAPFEVRLMMPDGRVHTTKACSYESASDDPASSGGFIFSTRW